MISYLLIAISFASPLVLTQPQAVRGEVKVTGIRAEHRHGQTFVTWKDAAEAQAGADLRYSLYRSDRPITAANFDEAELVYHGVLNNSGTQVGYAFNGKDRLDPTKPRFVLEEGGQPMPAWSGVAVRTARKDGKSYYAVVATDAKWQKKLSPIVPGESATTAPIEEKVAPIRPIKIRDSRTSRSTYISGKEGLPLHLSLHGSQATGGAALDWGDIYVYFGTPDLGYRDGIPGIFSVHEGHGKDNHHLNLFIRDAIESPLGDRAKETGWFGYFCVPVGASHAEPRAYPFTERRVAWILDFVATRYKPDASRIYCNGQSMGAMGATQFCFRQPEIFAAVYPRLGRTRQTKLGMVSIDEVKTILKKDWKKPAPMFDGKSDFFQDRMDSVKWVRDHHEDLPFYGWCFGRQDPVAPWEDNLDMVKALTANRHGFAFAWNDGVHDSFSAGAIREVLKYYPATRFARNLSYPAFGNSSIDSNLGRGDRNDAAPVGGINLGFRWSDIVDEKARWTVNLSNDLCKAEMTVDVTPRRTQKFRPAPGTKFQWSNSAGGSGVVAADAWGLVTIEKVTIKPGKTTSLAIALE